jgi:hypothetical protein
MAFTVDPDNVRSLGRCVHAKAVDFREQLERTQVMLALDRLFDDGEQFALQGPTMAFRPSPQPLHNIGGNVLDREIDSHGSKMPP